MKEFAEGMPTATVHLDKPREIGFTMGALRRVKEKLGHLNFALDAEEAGLVLPVWVWACLPRSARAELSIEAVEDLIHPGNMGAIGDAIALLFKASTPDETTNPTQAAEQPAAAN